MFNNYSNKTVIHQIQKGDCLMVAYFENESALDKALNEARSANEVRKIVQDLEQRMAPLNWIDKAFEVYWSMPWFESEVNEHGNA